MAAVNVKERKSGLALKRLEQARHLSRSDKAREGMILQLIGKVYQEQGRAVQACEAVEQTLTLFRGAGHQRGQIDSRCLLSELYLSSGRQPEALDQAEEAMRLMRTSQSDTIGEARWRAWLALARAQRALGRTQEALKSYGVAAGLVEGRRLGYLASDELRIASVAERRAPHREWVDLLMHSGLIGEAFTQMEFSRSRPTLLLLGARWREENQHARLRRDPDRRERFVPAATLQHVQDTWLRPDEVLLEFFLGEPRSFVWLVTTKDVDYAILPGRKTIEAQVHQYLSVVATKPQNRRLEQALSEQRKLAARLCQVLLGRLAERLTPGQRLLVAPDGLLHYLPFETLIRRERYVIEDHEVGYVPSAGVLGLLRQSTGRNSTPTDLELLAFGDPTFGSPPEAEAQGAGIESADDVLRDALSAGGFRLPPLPNSRIEVAAISQLFPAHRRRIYLGATATEEALKGEQLTHCRRLHLATHSLIDERVPARSGVVLTLDDDPAEDGFLEVNEIASLDLNCDLVVLSACQTGRGQVVSGEGVVGLSRAFLTAGARSVAVTLWSVSDLSTADLMKRFYQHLVANQDAGAALRQARLELLESRSALRHPHYWGAFVLVGSPDVK